MNTPHSDIELAALRYANERHSRHPRRPRRVAAGGGLAPAVIAAALLITLTGVLLGWAATFFLH